MRRKTNWWLRGGLGLIALVGLAVSQPRVEGAPEDKVTICHIPPGNPENAHVITVGASAVPAHIANHGDNVGECGPGQ